MFRQTLVELKNFQLIVRELHFCRSSGLEFHESRGTNWTNPELGELCFTLESKEIYLYFSGAGRRTRISHASLDMDCWPGGIWRYLG